MATNKMLKNGCIIILIVIALIIVIVSVTFISFKRNGYEFEVPTFLTKPLQHNVLLFIEGKPNNYDYESIPNYLTENKDYMLYRFQLLKRNQKNIEFILKQLDIQLKTTRDACDLIEDIYYIKNDNQDVDVIMTDSEVEEYKNSVQFLIDNDGDFDSPFCSDEIRISHSSLSQSMLTGTVYFRQDRNLFAVDFEYENKSHTLKKMDERIVCGPNYPLFSDSNIAASTPRREIYR